MAAEEDAFDPYALFEALDQFAVAQMRARVRSWLARSAEVEK